MDYHSLPSVNACLNATSALFLASGFFFIKQKNILAHKLCMLSAFIASTLFLAGYLVYHAHAGVIRFTHSGFIRPVYFTILTTHTLLAFFTLPLSLTTLYHALKASFGKHRWIAKRTFPVWLYVSVTGVIVYWMLYHLK